MPSSPVQPNLMNLVPVDKLVPRLITDIRLRTDFTNEKELFNAQEISDILMNKPVPPGTPPSMTKRVLGLLKPTLIINSPLGQRVYAPYGEADPKAPSMWRGRLGTLLALAVGGVFLIGFGVGRVTKK
jgi:hypothetical protein